MERPMSRAPCRRELSIRMNFPIFRPILAGAQWPERLIACVGATLCLALTMVVCAELPLAAADLPVIVAPLGASAVLVLSLIHI